MIDYAVLCQAIADWKAGRAPTLHTQADTEVEDFEEVQEEATEEHTMIYQLPVLEDD
ncbi:MAG: hypothetical protein IPK80_32860 [Nannocystis sp.]|nr:hypothetical protein [Nannocystis sp.]